MATQLKFIEVKWPKSCCVCKKHNKKTRFENNQPAINDDNMPQVEPDMAGIMKSLCNVAKEDGQQPNVEGVVVLPDVHLMPDNINH